MRCKNRKSAVKDKLVFLLAKSYKKTRGFDPGLHLKYFFNALQ